MASWDDFLPTTVTAMPSLTLLDDSCRCSVCKDYLQGPMMTLCGHTFCSLCIRRALNADGRCPTCRSLEEESKLRKNLMIEEIVEAFLPFRQSLIDYAPTLHPNSPKNHTKSREGRQESRSIADSDQDSSLSPPPASPRPRRSSSRITRATKSISEESHPVTDVLPTPAGHIQCPICQNFVHQDKADYHVNRCLEGKATPPSTTASRTETTDRSHYFEEVQGTKKSTPPPNKETITSMTRLPKMSYAAMTDAKLRRTMLDMGINSQGNRAQLQRRCTEFIAMWNSNLDSKRPKSRKELLHDLKAWDRIQARPILKATDEEIDSANQSGKFDDNFQELIAQARESMRKRKAIEREVSSEGLNHEATEPLQKRQQT